MANTSFISNTPDSAEESKETVISIQDVGMMFNIANEQLNSLKEYAIALARKELYFKEFWALKNISLDIKKGDVLGIMGTNGSGKSTLLKILAGVLEPTEGTCIISGSIAPLIELGAGFDEELTARENVYLNGALLGYSKSFIEQHFDEIIDFAEIEDFLDMPIKNYSSGMVARIAFAIATVIIPDILIVDEVLSVGDFMFQQKCERRIKSLIKDHDVTVLIVSHSNDQIARLCNRAVWIEKGHMRMLGSAEEVCQTYSLVGGREGSAESEALILDTLAKNVAFPSVPFKQIGGESQVGLVSRLYPSRKLNKQSTVISLGEDASGTLLANSLSSILSTSPMTMKSSYIPDLTLKTLDDTEPERVVFIKTADQECTIETITSSLTYEPLTAQEVLLPNYEQGSLNNYHYGNSIGTWGDTALLSVYHNIAALNAFGGYIYQHIIPLFYTNPQAENLQSELSEILSDNFRRVFIVANEIDIPESVFSSLKNIVPEVIRFSGTSPYEINQEFISWQEETEQIENQNHAVLITPALFPQDGIYTGAFAAHHNAVILLEDSQNLDSVANAITYLRNNKDHLTEIYLVAENDRYSKLDISLLKKALV